MIGVFVSLAALAMTSDVNAQFNPLVDPVVRPSPPRLRFRGMECKDPTGVKCTSQEDFELLDKTPKPPVPVLTPEEKQKILADRAERERIPRGPDGYVLPSERSSAEQWGCGFNPGPDDFSYLDPITNEVKQLHTARCFYTLKMAPKELETMIHASWMNLERRDDYLQARGARIRRQFEKDAFAVYEPVWMLGWMRTPEIAISSTLPEHILMGVWASNARYCNWPRDDEGPPETFEAGNFFCTTETDEGGDVVHNAKLESISRAMMLFHKIEISKMSGLH